MGVSFSKDQVKNMLRDFMPANGGPIPAHYSSSFTQCPVCKTRKNFDVVLTVESEKKIVCKCRKCASYFYGFESGKT